MSFATGSSWGTTALLMPIAVPICYDYGLGVGIGAAAAVAGGLFGDHCSPISDTTIKASMASGSDHMAHVTTQIPYAVTAGVGTFIAYLIDGLTGSLIVGIVVGTIMIGAIMVQNRMAVNKYKDYDFDAEIAQSGDQAETAGHDAPVCPEGHKGSQTMKKIDMIVETHHMFTMKGDGVGYEEGKAVAVDKGKIVAIGTKGEIAKAYEADEVIDGSGHIVLPGLIDAHMHTTSSALRGVAQDVSNWMMHGAGPFLTNATRQTRAASGRLGIAEAVMNGTTTIGDEGPLKGRYVSLSMRSGQRKYRLPYQERHRQSICSRESFYDYDKDYTERDPWRSKGDLQKMAYGRRWQDKSDVAPQGPDFVSEETLYEAQQLASENNTFMYMHLSQGRQRNKQMMMRYRDAQHRLAGRRGLDDRLIGIHLTNAQEYEVKKGHRPRRQDGRMHHRHRV